MQTQSFQSSLTLCDPMDCSLPDSVCGIPQARTMEWVALPSSRDLPNPGIKPRSPTLQGRFFTTEPPRESLCIYIYIMHTYVCLCISKITYNYDNKDWEET